MLYVPKVVVTAFHCHNVRTSLPAVFGPYRKNLELKQRLGFGVSSSGKSFIPNLEYFLALNPNLNIPSSWLTLATQHLHFP